MYDRYKSKRKNAGIYKFLVVVAILAAVVFLGTRYYRYLAFWKFSQNKLEKRIETVRQIKDIDKKREALTDLSDMYERYKEEHMVDPDAFYVSGEVHYMLAETYLPGNFSELCINDRFHDISREAKDEFLKALKDIKKGCALDNSAPDDNRSFMLAKAGFYTDYSSPAEILRIIEKSSESIKLKENPENVRFYAIANILNKREDYGLKYLAEYGMVKDNMQGLLFYATAERIAKRYTGAIVSYKNVLARTSDDKLRKLVHVNLGKIYFNQSLYRESIDQFNQALKIDEKDNMPKIWIGKNYSAMGEKDKAKAIWSEVLTTDGTNAEVKKLLGIM
jgi:predicted negative regulator of RcsB-dependent stress response